uniref:uncharacterized protein LOC101603832 n=1 Tax=Jaculus jaculus TaxID=51337 RepID=UPI00033318E0|nr:uncharacterized protein LOC101603832 [Jaculus jaculus]
MIQAVLLLGCVFPSLVVAFPNGALTLEPAVIENEYPPGLLSSQIPRPGPSTCQDLLHTVPSLAPLPEYLSNVALSIALEEVGCSAVAHNLQLQLIAMGGKATTETLIQKSQNRHKEEGTGHTKVIVGDQGGVTGEPKRVQRSVTLPEACTHEHGWFYYELAALMVEFAEKLPSTDLVREFKTSAVSVTQKCTNESWKHLEEVSKRLLESPELENATMSTEDQIYFVTQTITILKRILVEFLQKFFQVYFG